MPDYSARQEIEGGDDTDNWEAQKEPATKPPDRKEPESKDRAPDEKAEPTK
jgi:hypothetical protein